MKKFFLLIPFVGILIFFALLFLVGKKHLILLFPAGSVAQQQSNLIFLVVAIMLVIIIPIYVSLFFVVFKFRSDEKTKEHNSNANALKKTEFLWWLAPTIIIFIISIITWDKTHALDPYQKLNSSGTPLKIQVVALQWKWLFLYPEQNIATVNFLEFPEKTPINFELTADAPMNSFWIPALSGQIYAMTGMSTKLHIQANKKGDFNGFAAEINGKGYSGMNFVARSVSKKEFDKWVQDVSYNKVLDMDEYERLAIPSENSPVIKYGSYDKDLYNKIIMKYQKKSNENKENI